MSEIVSKKFEDLAENKDGFDNPREKFDMTKIKELAADIKERGLTYPLQIWETERDGKPTTLVVGGERRRRAIGLLIESGEWPKSRGIDCKTVSAKTLKEAHYAAVADNLHREDLSSYELAKEVAALKIMGDSQKEIAQRLCKSETWVSRKLAAYEAATPALRNAWKAGKLPDDTVEVLAKLDEEEQKAEVETQLALREKEGRAGKSKAKKRTGKKSKKAQRAGAKELQGLLLYAEKAPRSESPYMKGVYDTLRFSLGLIEEDGFHSEFKKFMRELDKKLEAEEEAEERKRTNGHAEANA